jgi:electron transport complex protein RnfG
MKKSGNFLVQAWLVIALSLSFGAALAGVQSALKPRIDQNKLNDTIGQIPVLVPGAASGSAETFGEQVAYRATDADGKHVGWVIAAGGQGFADRIELLVGVDAKVEKITGLYILDQKETPGLGNKIVSDSFRGSFPDKSCKAPIVLTKAQPSDPQQVQGITGATISSESVVGIVNKAVADFRRTQE